jgi:hypothetical protein
MTKPSYRIDDGLIDSGCCGLGRSEDLTLGRRDAK